MSCTEERCDKYPTRGVESRPARGQTTSIATEYPTTTGLGAAAAAAERGQREIEEYD